METKRCSKCHITKLIDGFYPHKRDGHESICKACKLVKQRKYQQRPERKAKNREILKQLQSEGYFVKRWKEYSQRPEVKKRRLERSAKYRKDPKVRIKNMARWYTSHQIRAGKLDREPCALCGQEQVEAHHLDYNQPLLIVWLCPNCHRQAHLKKQEGIE